MKRKLCLGIVTLALGTLMLVMPSSRPIRAAGPWYVAPGGSDGNPCTSAGAPCETINGAVAGFVGEATQFDDFTLVVAKRTA